MLANFLDIFDATAVALTPGGLVLDGRTVRVKNGIARFSPDASYSSGNFSLLRERHATLQLDSVNGTDDRLRTFLYRTGWSESDVRGKLVLECGCGAGPDTEVLLRLGATVVAVDLTGTDTALANLGAHPGLCLLQASIDALPLKARHFDIVFCHRVIMHTPDPAAVMRHILGFVKPGGHAFVHSYSRDFQQMFRWKYPLRMITKRMDSERLYRLIERSTPLLFPLTKKLNQNRLLRRLCWHFVPYINHQHQAKYRDASEVDMQEMAIHETFDALSPRYDKPLSTKTMTAIADELLDVPFEIFHGSGFAVMRTLTGGADPAIDSGG